MGYVAFRSLSVGSAFISQQNEISYKYLINDPLIVLLGGWICSFQQRCGYLDFVNFLLDYSFDIYLEGDFGPSWFYSWYVLFPLAVRVGLIYLLSGFGGSILSSLFIQRNISVGASGALFGLLGAMLSELLTNWTIYANKVCHLP